MADMAAIAPTKPLSIYTLPSYSTISGFLPRNVEYLNLPINVVDIVKWVCAASHCHRVQGVYSIPHYGMMVSKCDRCGYLNVLVNGVATTTS